MCSVYCFCVRSCSAGNVQLIQLSFVLTALTTAQVEEDTDRDNFLTPWQAVDYGLIDGVIDSDKPGLVAPIGEAVRPADPPWHLWTVKEGRERRNLPGEHRLFAPQLTTPAIEVHQDRRRACCHRRSRHPRH